jgi:predicted dehydrogenase
MEKIGVAVVGYGFIGKIHARAVQSCAETRLVGVWTLPAEAAAAAEALPDVKVYARVEDVAGDAAVQAVVIGTPNSTHGPWTRMMLEAGKHVLVEKPMAMSVAEAEGMAALAAGRGLRLMTGHMWRFDREVNAVRKVLESGALGRVVKTKGYGIHEQWGPAGWFAKKELAGGGALVDMGVHALDTARYLLGDPMPVSVYASLGTYFGEYDVDDTGVLVVKWDSGCVSVIESGWWQPHMDGPEASTQLFGLLGYARVFPTMAKFTTPGKGPWLPRFPPRAEHCEQPMYDLEMGEFASAIREGREPRPGAKEGIVILKICEAAYRSSATNEVVRI